MFTFIRDSPTGNEDLMRRHNILLIASIVTAASVRAQQAPERGIRSDGRSVLLYPNGTWKPDTETATRSSHSNSKRTKPASSSERLEVLKGSTLSYDPAKWTVVDPAPAGGRMLRHTDGDGYAMVFAERIQVPMANLKRIIIERARAAAPDARLVAEEVREVNGVPVTCMEMVGTAQGVTFHYFGYYYSGKFGTIQLTTYTAANLFEQFKSDFAELLDGFEVSRS